MEALIMTPWIKNTVVMMFVLAVFNSNASANDAIITIPCRQSELLVTLHSLSRTPPNYRIEWRQTILGQIDKAFTTASVDREWLSRIDDASIRGMAEFLEEPSLTVSAALVLRHFGRKAIPYLSRLKSTEINRKKNQSALAFVDPIAEAIRSIQEDAPVPQTIVMQYEIAKELTLPLTLNLLIGASDANLSSLPCEALLSKRILVFLSNAESKSRSFDLAPWGFLLLETLKSVPDNRALMPEIAMLGMRLSQSPQVGFRDIGLQLLQYCDVETRPQCLSIIRKQIDSFKEQGQPSDSYEEYIQKLRFWLVRKLNADE
jgi:hypothetical protein